MPWHSLIDYFEGLRRLGGETACVEWRGYRRYETRFRELVDAASRMACELEERGVGKGDRVLVWGRNSAEWIATFYGCMLRGAVVVPMDRVATPAFAARVADQVDTRLVVSSSDVPDLGGRWPRIALEDLPRLLERHAVPAPYPSPPLARSDPLEIVFTSGTTSEPRGVVLTHGNVLSNLEPLQREIRKYLKYERLVHPVRFLNLLPLSHVFGQFLGLFVPPLLRGTVVFADTLNPSDVMQTVRRETVSVLVAVPRVLEALKNKVTRDIEAGGGLDQFRRDLDDARGKHFARRMWRFRRVHGQFGWKFWAFISGGSALDEDTEAFWERLGFAVIQGYGLTETTSLVSVSHPFHTEKRSIGKVLPGREVRLTRDGEILVRGQGVAQAYFEDGVLTPVAGDEEWFHTGDLGELDEEGNLFFRGRLKNVIVTPEGMNVYPDDLAAELKREAEVTDCVVLGIDRNGNAEPCAVVVSRAGDGPVASAVERVNRRLASYQRILHWRVWPEPDFPRTPTGKPRLQRIRQFLETPAPGGQIQGADRTAQLGQLIGQVTGRAPSTLDPGARLEVDLGLGSLDRVELLGALEDRYQTDLNETRFQGVTTVGDLVRMLDEPATRRTEYAYPRWAGRWPIRCIRVVAYYTFFRPLMWILGEPVIRGRENLRGLSGPVLVISNHVTMVDIGYVLAALPRGFRHRLATAMEGERLWRMRHPGRDRSRILGSIDKLAYALVVALFHVFPLPQRSGFRASFAFAGELVGRGHNLLVFPEGARTTDGNMAAFRQGIGLLAKGLDIPVVPVRIDGLWEVKQAGRRWTRPGRVHVTIGPPVRLDPEMAPEAITTRLEDTVRDLAS